MEKNNTGMGLSKAYRKGGKEPCGYLGEEYPREREEQGRTVPSQFKEQERGQCG